VGQVERAAYRLQQRASRVGFDWKNLDDALAHYDREFAEFREALEGKDPERIEEELGDLLFMLTNLSRFVRSNPEEALRGSIEKFIRRFGYIERTAKAAGKNLEEMSLEEMDALWDEAKTEERSEE